MNKKYITTTLPYINSAPHIGHAFEFCISDIISDLFRKTHDVILNVGVDEHGLKIEQKAKLEGYENVQEYCDKLANQWKDFCSQFQIDYDSFYRTTDSHHKEQVLKYFNEVKEFLYRKSYSGKYCVGCESFKTDKEIHNNKCTIHKTELLDTSEENTFFKLAEFGSKIKDILVDTNLSNELRNLLLVDCQDLSVTRKNVTWGINLTDDETVYVWFDALLNYIFAIGYYDNPEKFKEYWANSLQICGKDNLKFQAYIFQAILLSNSVPQTSELLVHGTILDENGAKMSKTLGNVINPIEQKEKWGLSPLKYYLTFGLSTYNDSKYSEKELVYLWNSDVVSKFGNLVSRTLHLIDIKNIDTDGVVSQDVIDRVTASEKLLTEKISKYDLHGIREILVKHCDILNKKYEVERPFDKNSTNYEQVLVDIFFELKFVAEYYKIILKEYKSDIELAFVNKKKVILFKSLKHE